jgi:DNA-binding GntR family transcriptional regulator
MQGKKTTIKKQVYDQILKGIIKKEFPLDEFLSEGELIKKYNVSKSPIREALVELCNENVLRSIPRLGYQIVQITEKDIKEATDVRLLLELTGLKNVFASNNKASLDKISKLNRECEAKSKCKSFTIEDHWEYNIRFHLLINSLGGNAYMTEVLSDILKFIWRAYVQLYSKTEYDSYVSMDFDRHIEIENAIRENNYDKAQEILKRDIIFIEKELFINSGDVLI